MDCTLADFKKWLNDNESILQGRTTDQIKDLALSCGFCPLIVSQWKTSQIFKSVQS